jgi:ABC-2 type transport system ATP-binding protein
MPTPLPTTIDILHLAKRYGSVEAINDVSFELRTGEIFGLLGQNGAGKTTTIECLLGLRQPDAGSITINGIDVLSNPSLARERVGAQLQSAALQDKITPREALRLFSSFYHKPADSDGLLTRLDLSTKACAPFDSLSGGQKQRLFLALALVNEPEMLVLDEPTAGLDPQTRRELHRIIVEFKTAGKSVLLSTHNLEEASTLCDRIGILHGGRLIACDTPAALIARARTHPRISFRTTRPLEPAQVSKLPCITNHSLQTNGCHLDTTNINQTISSLFKLLEPSKNEMLDLQIRRPSLEDVFIELTRQSWVEPSAEEKP